MSVFSYDPTYEDWLESSWDKYEGEYLYVEFEGSDYKKLESLTLNSLTQKPQVVLKTTDFVNGSEVEKRQFPYFFQIEKNYLKLKFKSFNVKGRFVYKYPPGKGKVEQGILIDNHFYSRLEDLEDLKD